MSDESLTPPPSFNQRLISLDVGETVAAAKRILRNSPEAGDIGGIKAKMRSSINPIVSKAKKRHGHDYVTDTGEFITADGHVVVVMSATRVG